MRVEFSQSCVGVGGRVIFPGKKDKSILWILAGGGCMEPSWPVDGVLRHNG